MLIFLSVNGSMTPRRKSMTWPVLDETTMEMHWVATLIAAALDSAHQYNDAARLLNYGYSVTAGAPARAATSSGMSSPSP